MKIINQYLFNGALLVSLVAPIAVFAGPLTDELKHRNPSSKTIEKLIKEGADVNEYSEEDGTPLFNAVERGHLTIAKLLIKNGADVNGRGGSQYKGLTALAHTAYANTLKSHKLARYLIEKGANPDQADMLGRNSYNEIIKQHPGKLNWK